MANEDRLHERQVMGMVWIMGPPYGGTLIGLLRMRWDNPFQNQRALRTRGPAIEENIDENSRGD